MVWINTGKLIMNNKKVDIGKLAQALAGRSQSEVAAQLELLAALGISLSGEGDVAPATENTATLVEEETAATVADEIVVEVVVEEATQQPVVAVTFDPAKVAAEKEECFALRRKEKAEAQRKQDNFLQRRAEAKKAPVAPAKIEAETLAEKMAGLENQIVDAQKIHTANMADKGKKLAAFDLASAAHSQLKGSNAKLAVIHKAQADMEEAGNELAEAKRVMADSGSRLQNLAGRLVALMPTKKAIVGPMQQVVAVKAAVATDKPTVAKDGVGEIVAVMGLQGAKVIDVAPVVTPATFDQAKVDGLFDAITKAFDSIVEPEAAANKGLVDQIYGWQDRIEAAVKAKNADEILAVEAEILARK